MDVVLTILVITAIAAMRSFMAPTGGECVRNVAVPLGVLLQGLEQRMPVLSLVVWAVVIFIAGINTGRYGVKYSLYPAYTLMAIPVFGIVAAGVMVSHDYLVTAASALCGLLSVKYLHRCIMRSGSFADLSLGMLWIGLLPLLFVPAAVMAYVVVPVLVLVVRPSWRDWVVAVASLLLPLAAVCYVGWCRGGDFTAPVTALYDAFMTPSGFEFFASTNPAGILLLGVLIVMVVCSASLVVSDKYSLKVKARAAMRFNALLVVACAGMFFVPSCTSTVFVLAAVPAAMLLPLSAETASANAVLPYLLRRSCRRYPTFRALNEKLRTLYRLALLFAAANTAVMFFL